ncbi:TetR/AcrR family transcriptional regulator [Mesoterricola sediminis]|uniref:TetR family transcriptional regulator n=1 Tax=Mesoterricola sediminis TaxID=2927980 RepID=A0AA48GPL5_9BACT|nr:TetR/AcrR family transcriptional regulator [Mesoterricola sediminis]BDU75252.1 TetR family transcriptional regulator [Mesoterricola sediminis]
MARPKSEDKRSAILAAATRVIAAQGLGAPTAAIAKAAGVSNGSLFTYFETKHDLFDQLYLELKVDMASQALADLPAGSPPRAQVLHLWTRWLAWARACPEKRRALAHLCVSDAITPASRQIIAASFAQVLDLLEGIRAAGPMRGVPLPFVLSLMNALADATLDFALQDPDHADAHGREAFEAFWRMLS